MNSGLLHGAQCIACIFSRKKKWKYCNNLYFEITAWSQYCYVVRLLPPLKKRDALNVLDSNMYIISTLMKYIIPAHCNLLQKINNCCWCNIFDLCRNAVHIWVHHFFEEKRKNNKSPKGCGWRSKAAVSFRPLISSLWHKHTHTFHLHLHRCTHTHPLYSFTHSPRQFTHIHTQRHTSDMLLLMSFLGLGDNRCDRQNCPTLYHTHTHSLSR